jgi:integrase/recombinase XerD
MSALAPSLQAFFTDRLIGQRAASPNTIGAYKTSFRLLLGFAAERRAKAPAALDIADLDAPLIAAFLDHLETGRHNSVTTRNNRLAAIHSLFAYLALRHPEHAASIARVLAIPPKRTERNVVTYLTEPEIDALLGACDKTTWTGRRDHAMFALTSGSPSWPASPAKTSPWALGPTSIPSAKAARRGTPHWWRPPEPC